MFEQRWDSEVSRLQSGGGQYNGRRDFSTRAPGAVAQCKIAEASFEN
jgi:hypothetical protein